METTSEKTKKEARLKRLLGSGIVGILKEFDTLETKTEEAIGQLKEDLKRVNPNFAEFIDKVKAKDADPQEIADLLASNPNFVKLIKPEDGKDFVPDELFKEEIATLAAEMASALVIPPKPVIVEKTIVEKTIVEQPIVTEKITEVTKEVAVSDDMFQLRDKLESLPVGERFQAEFIDGLDKLVLELMRKYYNGRGNAPVLTFAGNGGGRVVKSFDISSQLNGSLKTFNIPACWRVISIQTSSFPNALRENVDFTWTPQTVTFTSEIEAASTLATGQTVIVIYSE